MMRHIKSIDLHGFQSHRSSKLDLHPGLNIIVGASDSGKTAIQRAIRWCVHNEPLGDGFINPLVGSAEATIVMNDGTAITRYRGKENSYMVGGKVFQGFGTKVPEEVHAVTGMQKAQFGDEDVWLNYSSQLDAPYLLSETAGQAARILGKLAGTEDLDAASRLTNSELIKARQQKTNYQEQQAILITKLQAFEHFDKAAYGMLLLRDGWQKLESLRQKHQTLRNLQDQLVRCRNLILIFKDALSKITIPDIVPLKTADASHLKLSGLRQSLKNTQVFIDAATGHSRKLQDKLTDLPYGISPLSAALQKLQLAISIDGQLKYTAVQEKRATTTCERLNGVQKHENSMAYVIEYLTRKFMAETLRSQLESNWRSTVKTKAVILGLSDVGRAEERLVRYRSVHDKSDALVCMYAGLANIDLNVEKCMTRKEMEEGALKNAALEYEKYLVELGVCPVCQAPMEQERIHQHMEEVVKC